MENQELTMIEEIIVRSRDERRIITIKLKDSEEELHGYIFGGYSGAYDGTIPTMPFGKYRYFYFNKMTDDDILKAGRTVRDPIGEMMEIQRQLIIDARFYHNFPL